MESIRFDDIEKLRSKVSSEYSGWSQEVEVTQDKINDFADVTGDHQWIHGYRAFEARESVQGPVAHDRSDAEPDPRAGNQLGIQSRGLSQRRDYRGKQTALHLAECRRV